MAGLDLQYKALDDGQVVVRELVKDYSATAGGYPAAAADSTMFGKLDGASALAGLIDNVERIASDDLEYAHRRLSGVESGLEEVETNSRKATKAGTVAAV
ncbi:hypothetical protein HTZ77_36990 [Nonomuraea sp. SMC257]|uniref:Uncharacterized protein n=1 Tax=Nonomuraea montanisoli TaxID=2741721 RepID=A0A7Y6M715_9ACTN|nr:hypothetical protein [Nonomuraea montanisoli]NUW36962.1 hypothetical protein [Nonomuraea montanisoli]